MKHFLKRNFYKILKRTAEFFTKNKIGRIFFEIIFNQLMERSKQISHNNQKLIFSVPNQLNRYRVDSFSIKEPDTLNWIDEMSHEKILWDIGANIGLYSIYAAKKCSKVYCFEPSIFNLELLGRNIFLNNLVDKITIIPLPLTAELVESTMKMTSKDWGGALSSFEKEFGFDGKTIDDVFQFPILGISMSDAVKHLKLLPPDYIKIDVDGIEHIILSGGLNILKGVESILVEINDDFETQAKETQSILEKSGFLLKSKNPADYSAKVGSPTKNTYNQIWLNKNF